VQLFQILSAYGRASAPKVEKNFSILEISSKVEGQKLNVCASLTRLAKSDKKNYFGKFDQDTWSKMTSFD
jgi:hypothetical protein